MIEASLDVKGTLTTIQYNPQTLKLVHIVPSGGLFECRGYEQVEDYRDYSTWQSQPYRVLAKVVKLLDAHQLMLRGFLEKSNKRIPRELKAKKDKSYWQLKYESWWLEKLVVVPGSTDLPPKRVTAVKLVGPPSFFYGDVWLVFEDGTEMPVPADESKYRPSKIA